MPVVGDELARQSGPSSCWQGYRGCRSHDLKMGAGRDAMRRRDADSGGVGTGQLRRTAPAAPGLISLPLSVITMGFRRKSASPTPADGRSSVVPPGDRPVPGPARWLIIGLLGYEVLLPLGGVALAAGFDAPQLSAITADHGIGSTGSLGVILDDVPRISLPPGPARLREMPAPEAARRGRSPSMRR